MFYIVFHVFENVAKLLEHVLDDAWWNLGRNI